MIFQRIAFANLAVGLAFMICTAGHIGFHVAHFAPIVASSVWLTVFGLTFVGSGNSGKGETNG